ncbi:MAG: hypothetical protein E6J14_08345 [Chloroflexi bacterium]|nr:MAG: hypothetical protein E6J14_08345 [Chloroflexota bacterium]
MSQTLIAAIGFLGGMVVAVVDGPRAIAVASLAAGLGLAGAAASTGGVGAALLPLVGGTAAVLAAALARRSGERLRGVAGLSPEVPVVAARAALFGPRSVRVVAAALALPAASWVSLNVSVGGAASDQGAIFAAAYVWLAGAARLLRARALEDLGVGAAAVALAGATAWILEAGTGSFAEASAVAAFAAVSAAAAGWLTGRHRRPSAPVEESG